MKSNSNSMQPQNTPKVKIGKVRQRNIATILLAAKEEFVVHGYEGASMKRIAERANLPRANLHYYFVDKHELYHEILSNTLTRWNACFEAFTENEDPAKALARYIEAKVAFSQQDPLSSRLFASEIIHGANHLAEYLHSDFQQWVQQKVAVINYWVNAKKMHPVDPYHLLFLIWSSTQHYADFNVQVTAALQQSELTDKDYQQITAFLTHFILAGCGLR
jgi:TetR/AcrR family transcriptional regulator